MRGQAWFIDIFDRIEFNLLTNPLVDYTYDLAGRRTKRAMNNLTETDAVYDAASRITSVEQKNASFTFDRRDYGYNAVNNRTYDHRSAGGARGRLAAGQPAGQTEFPGGDEIDFQRKPAGDFARARKVSNERERASQKRNNTLGDAYAYDATRQVTGVQYDATTPDTTPTAPARTVAYAFDATGNRTLVTDNAIPTAYTANNLNQYTAIGADAPTHDTNGNLSSTGGWSYSYDAQNRLVGASNLTTTAAFAYDGRNRCVTRTINGTTTHYYFDAWNIIEEHNASGLQLAATAHGEEEDEPIFRWDIAGNLSYYHQDALGNITALTDTLGVPVEHYRYDIHGTPAISDALNQPRATSFFNNRFLFTGREYLCDLALYDYRNRAYSPALGRFLQTDPIGFDGEDVNLYRYVGNNSVNLIDPKGFMVGGDLSNHGINDPNRWSDDDCDGTYNMVDPDYTPPETEPPWIKGVDRGIARAGSSTRAENRRVDNWLDWAHRDWLRRMRNKYPGSFDIWLY